MSTKFDLDTPPRYWPNGHALDAEGRWTPLEVAVSQIGVSEETPEGRGRIHRYLGGDPREIDVDLEWCAAFVLWCFQQADQPIPGSFWRNRAVWRLQRELERKWSRVDYPMPGDVYIMLRGERSGAKTILEEGDRGHTGIVRNNTRSGFRGIEGNVGGRVVCVEHATPSPTVLGCYRKAIEID